jgi:hypothetical protein
MRKLITGLMAVALFIPSTSFGVTKQELEQTKKSFTKMTISAYELGFQTASNYICHNTAAMLRDEYADVPDKQQRNTINKIIEIVETSCVLGVYDRKNFGYEKHKKDIIKAINKQFEVMENQVGGDK